MEGVCHHATGSECVVAGCKLDIQLPHTGCARLASSRVAMQAHGHTSLGGVALLGASRPPHRARTSTCNRQPRLRRWHECPVISAGILTCHCMFVAGGFLFWDLSRSALSLRVVHC